MNTLLRGKRIRLIEMVDPYPVPPLSEGTIDHMDDMKQIHVKWDNGRTLAIVPDVDRFEMLDKNDNDLLYALIY